MRIFVTGANGFIGRNLCAELLRLPDVELFRIDIGNSDEQLFGSLSRAEFIVHLAGVNRPKDESDFLPGNLNLLEKITKKLTELGRSVPILLSSSKQAELENAYGRSKRAAEACLLAYKKSSGADVYIYRLPGVFGKWSRPFYNTVVATWCTQIAKGESVRIDDPEKKIELIYIDDVVRLFIACIQGTILPNEKGYQTAGNTQELTLGQLYALLVSFKKSRQDLFLPDFSNPFIKNLYATYLSFLQTDDFAYPLTRKADARGWLAEFIKSDGMGQLFVSTTKPGITRGNHWHHTKCEKFLVVAGEAEIKFRALSGDEVITYRVSGNLPQVLDIPPGYTHSIKNVGNADLVTLFWSNQVFDAEHPDTYSLEV